MAAHIKIISSELERNMESKDEINNEVTIKNDSTDETALPTTSTSSISSGSITSSSSAKKSVTINAPPSSAKNKDSNRSRTIQRKYNDNDHEFDLLYFPQKIKVKNTRPIYVDIMIFVSVIVFLFFYAFLNTPTYPSEDPPRKKMSKSGRILKPVPAPIVDYSLLSDCELVLHKSTIPNRGFGIFAISNFTQGASLSDFHISLPFNPDQSEGKSDGDDDSPSLDSIFWSIMKYTNENEMTDQTTDIHFATQLQHHPYLHNVDISTSTFKATKDILPGTELFITQNSEEEIQLYKLVDEIVLEMNNLKSKSRRVHEIKKQIPSSRIFRLLKSTVEKLNPDVAALLPTTEDAMFKTFMRGSAYQSLSNHTHKRLREDGKCMDSIRPGTSTIVTNQLGAFAKRDVKQGDLIMPALLYPIRKNQLQRTKGNESQKEYYHPIINYCMGHDTSSVLLCHRTSAALINHMSTSCPVKEENAHMDSDAHADTNGNACTLSGPNAEYQWSKWNDKLKDSHLASPDTLYKEFSNSIAMDIIALQDIKAGEEIFIHYGETWETAWENYDMDSTSSFRQPMELKEDLIPAPWKDEVIA